MFQILVAADQLPSKNEVLISTPTPSVFSAASSPAAPAGGGGGGEVEVGGQSVQE